MTPELPENDQNSMEKEESNVGRKWIQRNRNNLAAWFFIGCSTMAVAGAVYHYESKKTSAVVKDLREEIKETTRSVMRAAEAYERSTEKLKQMGKESWDEAGDNGGDSDNVEDFETAK